MHSRPSTHCLRPAQKRLCHNPRVSIIEPSKRPTVLAVFLLIAGTIGFVAAFALTLDKFIQLETPNAHLTCDIGVLVQCGKNLASPQGAVLGFPNPLIGIIGWTATIAVAVGIFARARMSRWYWLLFNLGVLGAIVLIGWLIFQSIYVLGDLCPWCMVTWAVTIPTFFAVTLYNLKTGNIPLPASLRRASAKAYSWVPLITLICYAAVAVFAQVRLDVLSYL